jgi:hypothetical protein
MTSRHLTERLSEATSQRLSAALRAAEQEPQATRELAAQDRDLVPACTPHRPAKGSAIAVLLC